MAIGAVYVANVFSPVQLFQAKPDWAGDAQTQVANRLSAPESRQEGLQPRTASG